jgi:hypothetical protein
MWNAHIRNSIHQKNRVISILLGSYNLRTIISNLPSSNIILEASIDEYLSLDIDNDDLTDHYFSNLKYIAIKSKTIINNEYKMNEIQK